MEYITDLTAFVFLVIEALEDLKSREIKVCKIIFFLALSLFVKISCTGCLYLSGIIMDILPGCIVLLYGYLSNQGIGYGDGAVIVVLGICLGYVRVINILVGAFICVTVAAVVLFVVKGRIKNVAIPFVPCILLSYTGGLFL